MHYKTRRGRMRMYFVRVTDRIRFIRNVLFVQLMMYEMALYRHVCRKKNGG